MIDPSDGDTSSSLDAVYDGLHGYIGLDDQHGDGEQIKSFLSDKALQRLRRVKQLGYVSQSFLSAEHNRYAHALGTMQMMRRLLDRLQQDETEPDNFWKPIISDVGSPSAFPDFGATVKGEQLHYLFQHLLVAALLQDVGEYPYAKATEPFFRPDDEVKTAVRKKFQYPVETMSNKSLMTLALAFQIPETAKLTKGLDDKLLAFLLSGQLSNQQKLSKGLATLREMLNGVIDADRLDYVYRDAYHTLGDKGNATPLIDSLVRYDEKGPILKHVRPIMDFLSKRALLWSTVYHSPENRFRIILLRKLFEELTHNRTLQRLAKEKHEENGLFSYTAYGFLEHFDDSRVERLIRVLAEKSRDVRMKGDASAALKFLSHGASSYEYQWVPFEANKDCDVSRKKDLFPSAFFFDRYSDYLEHTLYEKGKVRVTGSRYRVKDNGIVALEHCVGPFSSVLNNGWSSLPMPNHIAWFQPSSAKSREGEDWDRLQRFAAGQEDPELHGQFILHDPMLDAEIGFDNRKAGRVPGDIFVSFRWKDYRTVFRIIEVLKREGRKYYNLGGDYIGIGGTIESNSRKAVRDADAVMLVYSKEYGDRYWELHKDGALSGEVKEMMKRVGPNGLPVAVLSLDPYVEIGKQNFPWGDLGYPGSGPPAVTPLRHASSQEIERAVFEALSYIDSNRALAK